MNRPSQHPANASPALGEDKAAKPLELVAAGQEVELARVAGGRALQHRLAEMGLTPGVRFRVLSRGRPGPIIILLKGSRLMLGRGMIHRVSVRIIAE